MEPSVLAELDAANAHLAAQHQRVRDFRRVGLLVGSAVAFAFGGLPGLVAACLLVSVVRLIAVSR